MSEKILKALMQLFAVVSNAERMTLQSRQIVQVFLQQQLNRAGTEKYLAAFDEYLRVQRGTGDLDKVRKRTSVNSVKVLRICTDINQELNQRQKYVVLVRLLEFIHASAEAVTEQEWEFLTMVAGIFNIPESDYRNCLALATPPYAIPDSDAFLILGDTSGTVEGVHVHRMDQDTLGGRLVILFIRSTGIAFFRYTGSLALTLNGQAVGSEHVHVFTQGSVIRGPRMEPVYYSDVIHSFLHSDIAAPIRFAVEGVSYKFKSGNTGLHPLSFAASSGELIGIMGGSGAGKSTLLNVLNGNYAPTAGKVTINGHDLHGKDHPPEGLIGYIPQDDLLMEDLSVFQNLYYNTKLCHGDLDEATVTKKVENLLEDLGLSATRDLKVGSPLNQTISGGQRKRLNIALELIREAPVLFVDEPTSGLSSRDSENVMDLLKQITISGKLIFVVIHQPSSDIFKLFDKLLLLDTGGYPIYYGNPSDALLYFRRHTGQVNTEESECPVCGNINPEQLFAMIEARVVDEFGNPVNERKTPPAEWNRLYKENFPQETAAEARTKAPDAQPKPSWFRQFGVFLTRDVLSKLSNRQYLLINLLEAPLLAFLLAYLIRYHRPGQEYSFRDNQNIPAFLFMGVIVALFIGLSVSAEEIFRDRKILKRESFLHLSRSSYLLSKISVLVVLSAVQMILFVLIGNNVLGLHDMNTSTWLILFSTACFANLLGLNISSAFNSAVTIYILIPILIIPQILLSGIIVKFEKLNPAVSTHHTVPIFGELMASRWAFEALAVHQFKNNKYERHFFDDEQKLSKAVFRKDFLVPELIKRTDYSIMALTQESKRYMLDSNLRLLSNEAAVFRSLYPALNFPGDAQLKANAFNAATGQQLKAALQGLRQQSIDEYNNADRHREAVMAKLGQTVGTEQLLRWKDQYLNESLADLLKNSTEQKQIEESDFRLIQRFQPVFMEGDPGSFIRAPFFASRKMVFGQKVETPAVNIGVLWAMTIFLAFTLHFDLLKRVLNMGDGFRWRRKK